MKFKKLLTISGACLLGATAIATAMPFIVSCSPSKSEDTQKPSQDPNATYVINGNNLFHDLEVKSSQTIPANWKITDDKLVADITKIIEKNISPNLPENTIKINEMRTIKEKGNVVFTLSGIDPKKVSESPTNDNVAVFTSGNVVTITDLTLKTGSSEPVNPPAGVTIKNNIVDIKKEVQPILDKKTTVFIPTRFDKNWKEWDTLTDNINQPIYNKYYAKSLTTQVVEDDIKIFLTEVYRDNNEKIYMEVQQPIKVTQNGNKFTSTINFKVQNTNSIKREFNMSFLDHYKITIKPKEIVEFSISFDTEVTHYFYTNKLDLGKKKYYFGYSLNNLTLNVNKKPINYKNINLNFYSKALNTMVQDINTGLTYSQIEKEGNSYLDSLNADKIKQDIEAKIDFYVDLVQNNIGNVQIVLQQLLVQQGLLQFLSNTAKPISAIVANLTNMPIIQPLVEEILLNKSISEILSNPKIEPVINQLVAKLPKPVQPIAKKLIDYLKKNLNTPVLTFLFTNIDKLIPILKKISPSIAQQIELWKSTIDILTKNLTDPNKSILDTLVEVIKDPGFKTNLSNLLPPKVMSILDLLIFNNPNFNKQALADIIDVIANPKASQAADAPVVNYQEWMAQLGRAKTFEQKEYDQKTHIANIKFNYEFKFGQDIYFNIKKLLNILPSKIPGLQINIDSIKSILPDWIGFKANDYISYGFNNQNTKLEYDVVKDHGKNYIVWKMVDDAKIDVHLPNTVKIIYDGLPGSIASMVKGVLAGILYHKYNQNSYFVSKPNTSNPTVASYNYKTFNDQAILLKTLTPEQKQTLKEQISKTIKNVKVKDSTFIISEGGKWGSKKTIDQTETTTTYQLTDEVINQLFDLANYTGPKPIAKLEVNDLGVTKIIKVKLFTPYNIYLNGIPTSVVEVTL